LVEYAGAAVEIDPGDVTVGSDQNSVWVGYESEGALESLIDAHANSVDMIANMDY
jgi:hypothetical protein